MLTMLDRLEARMLHSGQLLTALSYRSVLARGFALVRNEAGHPLHAAADVEAGARLDLEFSDGRVAATAGHDQPVLRPQQAPTAPRRPRTPKRTVKSADQGNLF
jgi:exodeoxyribonuclease VII large subunit